MPGFIESIRNAISNDRLDESWNIKREDLCNRKDVVEFKLATGVTCEINRVFSLKATYQNKSGAELLVFSGVQPKSSGIFQLSAVNYTSTINGRTISLTDYNGNTDNGSIEAGKPDGKITGNDGLTIDGESYILIPIGQNTFELEAKYSDKFFHQKAKYDGLQFKKDGDEWISVGPHSDGEEIAKLLKDAGIQYSFFLEEAGKTLKQNTPGPAVPRKPTNAISANNATFDQ